MMTKEQRRYIIEHYDTMSVASIARNVNVSTTTVWKFAREIGLNPKMSHRAWTDEEKETLRQLYPMHSSSQIGKILHRTGTSVRFKAGCMGLQKSPEFAHLPRSEETCQKIRKVRSEQNRKERFRERYGLERKTKLHIVVDSFRVASLVRRIRHNLKKHGYIISRASCIAYYESEEERNHKLEEKSGKYFEFLPIGTESKQQIINHPPTEINL